jgi:hypothetical protein
MWGGDYFNMQELEPQRNLPQIYADHRRLKTTPLTTKDTKEHGGKAASKKTLPLINGKPGQVKLINTIRNKAKNFNRRGRKGTQRKIDSRKIERNKISRRISTA